MSREQIEMERKDGTIVRGLAWTVDEAIGNVVLITGMEEHSGRYADFAAFLNAKGYSVFCIDHYGQGENVDSLDDLGKWEKSGFRIMVNTVDELVSKLRITCRPIYIIAHSMGSFIAQDYIQRYGNHIDKVVLIGTCGKRIGYKAAEVATRLFVNKRNYDKPSHFFDKLIFGNNNKKIKNPRTDKDWISLSDRNVDAYIADEKCGYGVTRGFYKEMFKGINRLFNKKFLRKIRKDLPILILSGEDDPVSLYGKGATKLMYQYKKLGIRDVDMKLYSQLRHEILNEDNKQEVYDDIVEFLKKEEK